MCADDGDVGDPDAARVRDVLESKLRLWESALDTVCVLLNTDTVVEEVRLPFFTASGVPARSRDAVT